MSDYWKSALINQAAHAGVGALMALIMLSIGVHLTPMYVTVFALAWLREFWQSGWRIQYALGRWRKWNDVAWFIIGAAAMAVALHFGG